MASSFPIDTAQASFSLTLFHRMNRRSLSVLFFILAIGVGWYFIFGMNVQADRDRAAAKNVTPLLEEDLTTKGLKLGAPVFIRAFKEERKVELWIQETGKKTFALFRTYRVAASSGDLGPKFAEGDRQVPEGFYFVPPSQMNPNSRFHLAFNVGYPNAYDRAHGRHGTAIMIHGSEVSTGCLAMTDPKIEEIYTLCDAAHRGGQKFFRVHLFPFRMNSERMFLARDSPWYSFWKNLETGYQWFEQKKIPPNATVQDKKYHFGD